MPTLISFSDKLNIDQQANRGENSNWFELLANELQSTADRTSLPQVNKGNSGVLIEIIAANAAGSPSFVPEVHTTDDAGNDITLVAFTAITGNGTKFYWVHPVADKTATIKSSATEYGSVSVPRDWHIKLAYTGTPASDKLDTQVRACYVE